MYKCITQTDTLHADGSSQQSCSNPLNSTVLSAPMCQHQSPPCRKPVYYRTLKAMQAKPNQPSEADHNLTPSCKLYGYLWPRGCSNTHGGCPNAHKGPRNTHSSR